MATVGSRKYIDLHHLRIVAATGEVGLRFRRVSGRHTVDAVQRHIASLAGLKGLVVKGLLSIEKHREGPYTTTYRLTEQGKLLLREHSSG